MPATPSSSALSSRAWEMSLDSADSSSKISVKPNAAAGDFLACAGVRSVAAVWLAAVFLVRKGKQLVSASRASLAMLSSN